MASKRRKTRQNIKKEMEAISRRRAIISKVILALLVLATVFGILMAISPGFRLTYYEVRYKIGGVDSRVMAIKKSEPIGESAIRFFLDAAREDENWQVRGAAYIALARLGLNNPKVLPELLRSLDDKDWHVRANGALLIGSFDQQAKDATKRLEDALRTEKHEDVLRNIRAALERIER